MQYQGCQDQSNVQSEIFLTSKYFLLATLVKLLGAFCSPNNTVFTDWAHFVAQNEGIMHLSFYAIGFYALLSRKIPGVCRDLFREFTHDKKPGFWAGSRPGFDQEGCKFPFNELNF